MCKQLIKIREVMKLTALSRSGIYGLISKGVFPAQIKLGCRSSGWVYSEVQQWIEDNIVASRNN